MKDALVPPAPTGTVRPASETKPTTPSASQPMSAGFLRRVYISLLAVGAFSTILAATRLEGAALGCFVGGFVLAALLLKGQEIMVRGLLKPQSQLGGFDAKLGALLLMPLKFVGIGAVLVGANMAGVLRPIPLALGFSIAFAVVLAKLAGWFLMRALRSNGGRA